MELRVAIETVQKQAVEKLRAGILAGVFRPGDKLVEADLHMDRSIALLLGQKSSPARRTLLEGLQRGLAAGKTIAQAMADETGGLVTGMEVSLVEAGERSGKLAPAFTHLARYFAVMDSASRQARQAMTYPLVLLHMAIFLPAIPAAISAEEGSSPWGGVLAGLVLLWGLIIGGGWLWNSLSRRAAHVPALDTMLGRLPLVGAARRHWAMVRFTQVFHAGLLAGLNMSQILRLSGSASQSSRLHVASEAAAVGIEAGETLSLALADTGAFPMDFVNAVATAEEVGALDREMARRTIDESLAAKEAVTRVSTWLPKIIYALVVIFVVYRIFGMIQGYYGGMLRQLEDI